MKFTDRTRKWLTALAVAPFAVTLVVLVLLWFRAPPLQPPAIELSESAIGLYDRVVQPLEGCLEPDEILFWRTTTNTARDEDVLMIRTVYSAAEELPVVRVQEWRSLRRYRDGVQRLESFDLPVLEPGDYYLLVSISGFNTRPLRYRVPFEVSETCVSAA